MGNSFILFDVSIVISHGQFHSGNRGHTQNTDSPWVKSLFPVGKRSSGTATNIWLRKFHFKDLIAIFWGLQTLWPYQLTKPDFSDLGYFSGHVLSKTKSVTPIFLPFWQ